MDGSLAPVTGAVRSVHTYLNMCVTNLSTFERKTDNTLKPQIKHQGLPTHLLFQMGQRCILALLHLVKAILVH